MFPSSECYWCAERKYIQLCNAAGRHFEVFLVKYFRQVVISLTSSQRGGESFLLPHRPFPVISGSLPISLHKSVINALQHWPPIKCHQTTVWRFSAWKDKWQLRVPCCRRNIGQLVVRHVAYCCTDRDSQTLFCQKVYIFLVTQNPYLTLTSKWDWKQRRKSAPGQEIILKCIFHGNLGKMGLDVYLSCTLPTFSPYCGL